MERRTEGARHSAGRAPATRYKNSGRGYNATQKRKRKIRAFYITIFLVVVVVAAAVLATLTLKFADIVVTGSSVYTQEEIQEACPIKTGDGLLSADLKAAKADIEKNLPYIGEAEVSIRFPSKLIIKVEHAEELCLIRQGSYGIVISDKFKVLQVSELAESDLLKVDGITLFAPEAGSEMDFKNDEMMNVFKSVFEMLNSVGFPLAETTNFSFEDLNSMTLNYQNRLDVMLGSMENLEYKLTFAKSLLENTDGKGIGPNDEGTLDLSRASDTDSAVFSPKTEEKKEETSEVSSVAEEENTEEVTEETAEETTEETPDESAEDETQAEETEE